MPLAQTMQGLFASTAMRVNTTTDVVGVEICGALKNVLAIAAGIVEGLELGHNAMAALISQVLPVLLGCPCSCVPVLASKGVPTAVGARCGHPSLAGVRWQAVPAA